MSNNVVTRYALIDHVRASAILLMIVYHLMYDLRHFKFIDIEIHTGFWFYLTKVIVFLFLFCVGFSLRHSHIYGIQWKKFNIRLARIVLFALLISLFTYIVFPESWVYFGALHCIAVTSVIALPFVFVPRLALFVGLLMIVLDLGFGIGIPFYEMSQPSMDYIPVFPWLGVVLMGIYFHYAGIHKFNYSIQSTTATLLSRHALIIYVVHQPLLFSLVYLIDKII